jgi:hypothetical protein
LFAQQSSPAIGEAAKQKQRMERFLAERGIAGQGRAGAAQALAAARARQTFASSQFKAGMSIARPHVSAATVTALSAAWQPVGPAQVSTAAYGLVTGRVTSIAADPADATGNTVYVGSTGGGVWKSTNAAGPASAVTFAPLTDTTGVFASIAGVSLSIGALTVQPGGTGVILAGTGDPNSATDSYYGAGILRSADHGVTWTLLTQTTSAANGAPLFFTFFGNSFAGFAWSTTNPNLVVAAVSSAAEGPTQESLVNAGLGRSNIRGLYYSQDAGQSWRLSTISDGIGSPVQSEQTVFSGPGNAATSVVWNPVRQMFYAAVRFHGYYQSADGITWTRLANQPGASQPGNNPSGNNLNALYCPANPGSTGSTGCPIFRGALAVQPVTGDLFSLTADDNNFDQGLWRDACGIVSGACANTTIQFANQIGDAALEARSGNATIPQAGYDLYLAAVPSQGDTVLFAGTFDIYKCSLTAGCAWLNTTKNISGCRSAKVAPAQHALDASFASLGLLYFGNDGGVWRTTDLVNEGVGSCPADDVNHYQNLNSGLGSLAEVENIAEDVTSPQKMMASLGALGTAAPQGNSPVWQQVLDEEGNDAAIDPANPQNWYATSAFGLSINLCTAGSGCDEAGFGAPVIADAQVDGDGSAQVIPAPWILDPQNTANILLGTCRLWRGPGNGSGWSSASVLSPMLDGDQGPVCNGNAEIRSVAASGSGAASELIYAGMAGLYDGGGAAIAGHLFSAPVPNNAVQLPAWTDLAQSPVVNASSAANLFNPGSFDISSIFVDPHDPTGQTVYVTVEGFSGNGINAAQVYASTDGGAHWTNITSNLPNAPANSIVVDPNDANTVYVATDAGVWVTTDVTDCPSDNCWTGLGTSLPNAPAVQLATFNAGGTSLLRVATYGRGIWQIPLVTAGVVFTTATAAPAALTFPAEQVGTQSGPQQVLIANTGTATLTVGSLNVTGDFEETDTCSAPVAPGNMCAVNVTFSPTQVGARSGVLTAFGNISGGQLTVSLAGTGTPGAAVVLTPLQLAFPQTLVGQTAAAMDITISNTGPTTASLSREAVTGDFAISANTCGGGLNPDSGCTLAISFAPSASGIRSGTLTVVDSAGTQTAQITGVGVAPATDSLAPASLSFSAQMIGTASPAQLVTLTNSGDRALQLVAAQVTGDFLVVNNCGTSLSGHSSCALALQFVPTKIGAEQGTLMVSDAIRTQTVNLSGTGLAPAGVSVTPASINFGDFGVAGTPPVPVQTVTVTNNGAVALTGLSSTVSGDFAIQAGSPACGSSLAPGTNCLIDVTFSPSQVGTRNGTLTVTAGGLANPLQVALAGNGVAFTLQSTGPSSSTITSGQTATFQIQILPVNGSTGTVMFTCTGAPPSSTCAVNPASLTLSGTATASATVTIATGQPGLTAALAGLRTFFQGYTRLLALLVPFGLVALRRRRCVMTLLLLPLLFLPISCGLGASAGSGSDAASTSAPVNTTPPATYTITVTGAVPGLSHSLPLTLVVE